MSSRYSAARPKRAGEAFARVHHGEDATAGSSNPRSNEPSSKKVKFDLRNPSALAPDAREEDDGFLEADVIGIGSGATKRGAVNIEGYDSDSENETFNARAESREAAAVARGGKRKGFAEGVEGGVDLNDQLDNYDARLKGKAGKGAPAAAADDEDEDMFAEEIGGDGADGAADGEQAPSGDGKKKWKEVRFLDAKAIEGEEEDSKSGGHVRLHEESSSDDDSDAVELAIQEEGVDEEVGAGGLKKHAPKIDAFNMRQEQEEGAFDEAGNYIRKAADPDAVHDRWLEGVSRREMRRAAAARERREAELRQKRREDDSHMTADLFGALIARLERGETALEALARLGRDVAKGKAKAKAKKVPKWKQKKQKAAGAGAEAGDADAATATEDMDVDKENGAAENPEQARAREAIDAITEAADRLLNRDYPDIYDKERELLMREYRAETGENWVDPPRKDEDEDDDDDSAAKPAQMWEYRWTDGRAGGAKQGPFDGPTMKAWQDAGYFGEGVEFRPIGGTGWSSTATFV